MKIGNVDFEQMPLGIIASQIFAFQSNFIISQAGLKA
jgi:hypothetical protein